MSEEHVAVLKQARESFVRKRRAMAAQMVPDGAAAAHFAPSFADLQAAIEAIDRAIHDEENVPEGYAALEEANEPRDEPASSANVVSLDFDPA